MSVGALKVAKRPAAAGAAKTDPITNDAVEESNNKYEAAMLLTHRDEWQGLQNCGFGNQKN